MHRLAAKKFDDLIVVLVRDDRNVGERRQKLFGVEGLAAQDRVQEHDDSFTGLVREGPETELAV